MKTWDVNRTLSGEEKGSNRLALPRTSKSTQPGVINSLCISHQFQTRLRTETRIPAWHFGASRVSFLLCDIYYVSPKLWTALDESWWWRTLHICLWGMSFNKWQINDAYIHFRTSNLDKIMDRASKCNLLSLIVTPFHEIRREEAMPMLLHQERLLLLWK